jgi:hypothetical protein
MATIKLADGSSVSVQAKGLKLTQNGKVIHPFIALKGMSKGDRRRVRRQLSRMGRGDLAYHSIHG